MTYAAPKDSSSPSAAELAELLRLVGEDRAESAPPQLPAQEDKR
ncbi:hypothetical protein BF49_4515 [Bradyrhizobium sp.]|nr:hypothetical protein [Bradyrhizobium sp.]CUT13435.1 hypothetical protein BF49_4515 [Bradyrhizobium sp.]